MLIRSFVVVALFLAAGCGDLPVAVGDAPDSGARPQRVRDEVGGVLVDGYYDIVLTITDSGTDGGGAGDHEQCEDEDAGNDEDAGAIGDEGSEDEAAGHDKECLCHKGRKTLCLPAPAVDAHLGHGDSLGECAE